MRWQGLDIAMTMLTVCWALAACDATIHQYPLADGDVEPTAVRRAVRVVAVDAAEKWRLHKQVRWTADGTVHVTDLGGALCESEEKTVARRNEISGALEIKLRRGENQTLVRQRIDIDNPLTFNLLDGPYRLTAWADFRPASDTGSDWLWDTSDLTHVSLYTQRLPIETALCEGLAASVDTVVTPPADEADTMMVVLPLGRTMGRIRFVPDDAAALRELTGAGTSLMARVSYTQFVPTGFDAERHTTCFVVSGYERHTVTTDADGTLTDLVLCPADRELALRVSVTYFLPSGEELGTVSGLPVPLWQGRETVVTGPLLTGGQHATEGAGGLGIDDTFAGENIVRYTKRRPPVRGSTQR